MSNLRWSPRSRGVLVVRSGRRLLLGLVLAAAACMTPAGTASAADVFAVTADHRLKVNSSVLAPAPWQDIGHANGVTAFTAGGGLLWATTSDNRLWYRSAVKHEVDWVHVGHANHKTKGDLRVVDSAWECKPGERPLAWQQHGIDKLVVRSSEKLTVAAFGPINRQAQAFCLPGEKVVSGGADITGIPGGTRTGEYFTFVVRDHPLPEPPTGLTPSGWLVEATNISAKVDGGTGAEDSVLRAHVVCGS